MKMNTIPVTSTCMYICVNTCVHCEWIPCQPAHIRMCMWEGVSVQTLLWIKFHTFIVHFTFKHFLLLCFCTYYMPSVRCLYNDYLLCMWCLWIFLCSSCCQINFQIETMAKSYFTFYCAQCTVHARIPRPIPAQQKPRHQWHPVRS